MDWTLKSKKESRGRNTKKNKVLDRFVIGSEVWRLWERGSFRKEERTWNRQKDDG